MACCVGKSSSTFDYIFHAKLYMARNRHATKAKQDCFVGDVTWYTDYSVHFLSVVGFRAFPTNLPVVIQSRASFPCLGHGLLNLASKLNSRQIGLGLMARVVRCVIGPAACIFNCVSPTTILRLNKNGAKWKNLAGFTSIKLGLDIYYKILFVCLQVVIYKSCFSCPTCQNNGKCLTPLLHACTR